MTAAPPREADRAGAPRPVAVGPAAPPARRRRRLLLGALVAVTLALVAASLATGGYDITLRGLLTDPAQREMFLISRVPRTLALVFSAVAMGIGGVVMQLVTQNRFVEPTTAGTTQWAGLGFVVMLVLVPGAPPLVRMLACSAFAFIGTMLFLGVLRGVRARGGLVVPLVGIMLGAVVGSGTLLLATTFDLQQSLGAWRSGGFSSVVRGFYEPLWAVAAIAVVTVVVADRLTVVGLGRDVATSLGLRYRRTVVLGVSLVALSSGVTSVVVGFLPFLGLIVPNVVSIVLGDDVRRNLPWVALLSAALLIACDLVGRTVVAPMEVPASVVLGVVGAVAFLALVLSRGPRAAP